eukprot:TRINITY_DN13267_c0_g1_i1.p1 TRINITY_DN13267_c0_g1~~TRINITY_DN13267_c0_g1_i1.p1  ORF type:complete len:256 (-),score=29.75 TRINITY_DN13267_c0_g1_i1:8-706(-)
MKAAKILRGGLLDTAWKMVNQPLKVRIAFVEQGVFWSEVWDLTSRPVTFGDFSKSETKTLTVSPVTIFCEVLRVIWRLWSDCSTILQKVLDYFAEKMSSKSLAVVATSQETINVIKEIARTTEWPNNPMCGGMMTQPAAKTILARVSRDCSFPEATTVPVVRAMNFLPPNQPYRDNSGVDLRQVCSLKSCCRVEETTKFPVCGNCKSARYCSRECQKVDWPRHKIICKAKNL